MRVIFLGHCSFNTIKNLTDAVKNSSDEIQISVVDLFNNGRELSENELKRFDEVLRLPVRKNVKYKSADKFFTALSLLKENKKRRNLLRNIFLLRLRSLNNYIKSETEEIIYSKVMKEFLMKYDIFHFHYLEPGYLMPIKYIDENKKIILSVWGSDLLQIAGVENYRKQLEAFERADIITMYTLELKEIFLSKFGRHLSQKIRLIPFGQPAGIFDRIDLMKNLNAIIDFRNKNNIPGNKIIITIGYNGSSKQRHIEILRVLEQLDNLLKEKFHMLIPMSYGLEFEENGYLQKVKERAYKTGISFTILTEYLMGDELIKFILANGITLNLRETDCMNAAMLESLYCENIVVNGSWLAYGKLRRLGVYYKEIEDISELKSLIPYLLENYEAEKRKTRDNPSLVRNFISYENNVQNWLGLYGNNDQLTNNLKPL